MPMSNDMSDKLERLREALADIERLRLATDEGSLRVRADRMWEIAREGLLSLPRTGDDWRCVNCKRVIRSVKEPERSLDCKGRTFAHVYPEPHVRRPEDVKKRARAHGLEEAAKVARRILEGATHLDSGLIYDLEQAILSTPLSEGADR
jgi:hypothetical protein